MTHHEFSSRGGKAMKGTLAAKERAKKGAAARWGKSLADRSPYIADKEARGLAKRVGSTEPPVSTGDSFVELDEQAGMPDYDRE